MSHSPAPSFFRKLAETSSPACLVTIFHQDGSTPRTAGARMLVSPGAVGQNSAMKRSSRADASPLPHIEGTIGGGLVEAKAIAMALEVFETQTPMLACFDLSGQANVRGGVDMDMICGGCLEVLLEPVTPALQAAFACLEAQLLKSREVAMITTLSRDFLEHLSLQRGVYSRGPRECWRLDHGEAASLAALSCDAGAWFVQEHEGTRRLVEHHQPPSTLYLFGAGHVSQATALVAQVAGFRVVVLDDRPEFANAARFPTAELVLTPPSFDGIFQWPGMASHVLGPSSYVAILTRGHRHDAEVLAQALGTAAGWIGMIGSRKKRNATYARLHAQGVPEAAFARVHSPIGLAIGAQTPGEIAVSILAQCIRHRAGITAFQE